MLFNVLELRPTLVRSFKSHRAMCNPGCIGCRKRVAKCQVILVTAARDLVVTEYNLLAAIGRLSVVILPVTNMVYDQENNYYQVNRRWRGGGINDPELDRRGLFYWDDIVIRRD